jgi:large subunit ribosomal protein L29
MKVTELREMTSADLYVNLEQLQRHLFDLRAQAVTEKLENPHQLKQVRKDIARTLTILRERGEMAVDEGRRRPAAPAAVGGT